MPQSEDVKARLPVALKKRIKIAAAETGRSMNAEIVARLEQSFELPAADRVKVSALLAQLQAIVDGN